MESDDAASELAAIERQPRVLLDLRPVQDEPQPRTERDAVEYKAASDVHRGEVEKYPSLHRTQPGSQEVRQQGGYLFTHHGRRPFTLRRPRVPAHSEIGTQHVEVALRMSIGSVGIPPIG